jgi:heterodisulfide reductase subunit D
MLPYRNEDRKMASNFSYGDYFRAGIVLGDLLRTDENPSWLTKIPVNIPKTKNIIYLGCNVFKTVHLVETLCRILDYLEVDYKAVGGPVFCCGIVPRQKGDLKMGEGMFKRTATVFDQFEADTLVHWCPSCEDEFEFSKALHPLASRQIHFSEFLFNKLRDKTLSKPIVRRVALHYHGGEARAEHESQHALAILKLVPGLDVVALPAPTAFGTHCSSQGAISKLGIEGYQRLARQQYEEARRLSCDAIVTVYHSCHREYAKARRVEDVELVNYLTLVAHSLGLVTPEDNFQRLTNLNSLELALQELLPIADRRGIPRGAVESILKSQLMLS